ncbi:MULTISPECIES: right-handed parallel beta-helix repeat-containing protein [unclassified Micromonospora]|uniref:right-handed parallel beta-helix repeat-containing protein n=1 Tax=unclassified Micromonospora TaxID=2617518 RepID=UPI001E5E3C74|nr:MULTISPECIES: right-handed parallel beta-helix repeat-containing protein [unclassified Micromonospora]MDI5938159.1 right-handed parallel beta-helix repeat-containing protein [Micromonospora sp. DH15]
MRLSSMIAATGLLAGALVVLPQAAQAAPVRYEAETSPAVCTGTVDADWAGYSGSGFCNATNAVGAYAQFTVTAAAAGAATVQIRFANGATTVRSADLAVNGATVQNLAFEGTGAWSTWVTRTVSVNLTAGSNTVRLTPTVSAGLPNVDYLDVDAGTTTPPPATNALYVATNGDDGNPGTLAAPLRSIQRAVDLAQPGHTIYLRGGTYAPSTNLQLLKNGTSSQPITMRNYGTERVVIDGENMPHTPAPVGGSIPRAERGAIHIEGDWWRLVGLEIVHGPYAVFALDVNNTVFDRLVTRDNYESGIQIQGASSNNRVVNLDSYGNRDPRKNGESADGLAIKEGSGTGNVVRGARLWNNSDDGLDFWMFESPILLENSLAWGNGFNRWNLPDYTGDGNGFKLGGNGVAANHTVRNSMAWGNAVGGFIDNNNPGRHAIDHCTAWNNPGAGFDFSRSSSTLTKNLAVANGTAASLGSTSTGSGNSWNIGGTWSLASTDPGTITGPRTADGSIPSSTFLRPANGADVGARF